MSLDHEHESIWPVAEEPAMKAAYDHSREYSFATRIEAGLYAQAILNREVERPDDPAAGEVQRAELEALIADGKEAKRDFIEANQGLVHVIAAEYDTPQKNHDLSFDDLRQAGNEGLIRAIWRYDYRFPNQASAYLKWRIRRMIVGAVQGEGRTVRLTHTIYDHMSRVRHVQRQLTASLGRSPSDSEVAAHLGMDPERLSSIQRSFVELVPLDRPIDRGTALGDITTASAMVQGDTASVQVEQDADNETLREAILQALIGGHISRDDAKYVRFRYGLDDGVRHSHREAETALYHGKNQGYAIEKRALAALKTIMLHKMAEDE